MCVSADSVVTPTSPIPLLPAASFSIRLKEASLNPAYRKINFIKKTIHRLKPESRLRIRIHFLYIVVMHGLEV